MTSPSKSVLSEPSVALCGETEPNSIEWGSMHGLVRRDGGRHRDRHAGDDAGGAGDIGHSGDLGWRRG